jgi:putative transposase
MQRVAPSVRLQEQIEELLMSGLGEHGEHLAELGRLGARLTLQKAIEEEVEAFLGRARYERTPNATGSRNGTRPKPIQTAEGEITLDMPQVRNTAERLREPRDPGHQGRGADPAARGVDHRQLRARAV